MSHYKRGLWQALGLHLAVLIVVLAGCAPSRSQYYNGLHQRRIQAYAQWESRAEEPERPTLKGDLNLEEAVRLALVYNPDIQAALQEKLRAQGRMKEAYSEALPKLDLEGNYTRLDKLNTVDLGPQSFAIGDKDNYAFQVQVTQPIYKGGVTAIALRSARLFSYLTDERLRGAVEGVAFNVAAAYYEMALAERLIEVRQAGLKASRAHLKNVESKKRQGVATEFDVLRARVDVSSFEASLIEQKNRRDLARTELLKAIGASQQSGIDLATELDYRETRISFEEAVRKAFENRSDLYQASLEMDLQHEAVNHALSRYLPRIRAYYWNEWAKPDPHESNEIEWGSQWQAGLTMEWPLFDGLAREGQVEQQRALLGEREIRLSDAEQQALLEIRNSLFELENARELVDSQRLNLKRADRALELVQAGYREGVNTEVEILDATAALTRARGEYYRAIYSHTIARIKLQQAMGILGPPPGSREVPESLGEPGDLSDASGDDTESTGG